jgi:cell division septation protein DedD
MLRHRTSGLACLVLLIACSIYPVWPIFAQQPMDSGTYSVPKRKPQQEPPPEQRPQSPASSQPQQPAAPQQAQPPQPVRPGHPSPTPSRPGPAAAPTQAPANVTERVLRSKFGSEGFQTLLNQAESIKKQAGEGIGAPSADRWFDGAGQRLGTEPNLAPAGTPLFQGRPQGPPGQVQPSGGQTSGIKAPPGASAPRLPAGVQLQESPPVRIQRVEPPSPVLNGGYKPATAQDIKGVKENYGGIPGGVVLEGVATGLGRVGRVAYDPKFNAFALDDRAVYFAKVPAPTLAVLCRAIAQDERVGVSLGRKHIVYGVVPPGSDLAVDLKLADHFLGDIVFAGSDWTSDYRFPNGFRPRPNEDDAGRVAVFFNFNGFQFVIEQEEVRLTAASFDVRLVPLTERSDESGAHQPDLDAVARGRISRQYEANARHVADSIGYYQRERIISRTFAYGEAAAFARGLKHAGVDLRALANNIETAYSRIVAPPQATAILVAPSPPPSIPAPQTSGMTPPHGVSRAPSGSSYWVQIGAFREINSARAVAEKLRSEGFPVEVASVNRSGSLYVVRIGAFADAMEAAASRKELQAKGHPGFITQGPVR